MALAISGASQASIASDPTAALTSALADFESALTNEQKQRFTAQIQSYNQQKPDASSVIRFAAQIDAENHGKTRRSVGNRLCTFMDATLQFTDIVNTFVSANPTIAALIWGAVKTTMLIASNIGTYFDKITKMIMTVGQLCPLYKEFACLYGDSTALQQVLCEYYAIVVRLITKIVQVSQRAVVTSILSSMIFPFESEFGSFQNDLAEASQKVKQQASLAGKQEQQALARLTEIESKNNSRHRKSMGRFMSEIRAEQDAVQQLRLQKSLREAAKMRLCIKDRLSKTNPQIAWKQAQKRCMTNTGEWFGHVQDFQAWKVDLSSAALWCPGRMGVGKTVLISNIIAHLHTSLQVGDVISYHFCRSDDALSLTALNILGTLARQVADKRIEEVDGHHLQQLYNTCQDMSVGDMIAMMKSCLERAKSYYFVIDGLDECTQDQINIFATHMAKLYATVGRRIKLIYSGRPELEGQLFQHVGRRYRLALTKAAVNADIEHYIDTELDYCLQEQRLQLVNPESICQIRDTLYAVHDGLFLFTQLLIEEICMLSTESAVMEALGKPPQTISDLFAKRVQRVENHNLSMHAMMILKFCGCTKRPLTVEEFGELISMSTSQRSLDRGRIPRNMDQIITACCGLVYVEEEEKTVHYVHQSVKLHLFSDPHSRLEDFRESEVDTHLGHLCLTYLNFNDFKQQLARVNPNSKQQISPFEIGLGSIRESNNLINEVARKLLQTRRPPQRLGTAELSRKMEDVLGEAENLRLQAELQSRPFHLLEYAQNYWVWHLIRIEESSVVWERFSDCVRGQNKLAKRPWVQDADLQQNDHSMHSISTAWALFQNHAALLLHEILCEPCLISTNEKRDILRWAIKMDNYHLTVAIITDPRHLTVTMIHLGLHTAASCGREAFVKLFIELGADIDAADVVCEGQTALQAAASKGHLTVVEQLLASNADVNAMSATPYEGRTALQAAAERGHLAIVQYLLQSNADVNAAATITKYGGRTALQAAAGAGHHDVVKQLLAAGADVNAAAGIETDFEQTAGLNIGTRVQVTLEEGSRYRFPEHCTGRTALQAAAEGGHLAIVEELLAANADVHAAAAGYSWGLTALQAAAEGDYLDVVERLLAAGADANAMYSDNYRGRMVLKYVREQTYQNPRSHRG